MTDTPRLDSLTAGGTDDAFVGIRLADGHMLSLKTYSAGFAWVKEVFLFPGLNAPDAEAWSKEGWVTGLDEEGGWLSGLGEEESCLHYGVPVDAVRELIVQHGGEHENQEPPAPAAGEVVPDLLARVADLYGRFEDGYSAEGIRSVFGRIHEEGGPYLVCVWDYADRYGFGGNSQFYAEESGGGLFEVQPDVHRWLSGQQDAPGPVDGWVCGPVPGPTEFPVSDDFHNYARADLTD
ncbi:hypothetical protein ACIGW7_40080 [Streptomyces sp. NPDC053253]|uniref:hypothetical protein n=1 Tax=Streptomyces sp. NPDC053253 TaxID=3365699 RepID=UPI0037D78E30